MKKEIEELEKLKLKITTNLKEWVKDRSISLDERWNLFFKSNLGDHKNWIEDFKNLDSDDLVKSRDYNRHETVYLEDLKEYGVESIESDENYNEFREDVLSKFIKSFEWDW